MNITENRTFLQVRGSRASDKTHDAGASVGIAVSVVEYSREPAAEPIAINASTLTVALNALVLNVAPRRKNLSRK